MKQRLLERVEPTGQQHLLGFWDELDGDAKSSLAAQIESVDFALIERLLSEQQSATDWSVLAAKAESPPAIRLGQVVGPPSAGDANAAGEQVLRSGRVGAVLVAGGQGTRLGFPHPKGMFPFGPVSQRTLFQMFVDQLLALGCQYDVKIPLYLMTSPATHDETVDYFEANDRLGLAANQLHIFCQGTMPAVDRETGKVLLADQGQLALSPDGHGGMLAALSDGAHLEAMNAAGVDTLFYFQVDNPLVNVCDPLLLGYHTLAQSQMSTQVVAKRYAEERVGNVVAIDGQVRIIEYSDLPPEAAAQCNANGTLRLWAGNIAVHVFSVPFLCDSAKTANALPFHRAYKRVACINQHAEVVEPDGENGVKFERFIFDLLPLAKHALVMEVDPVDAFAPIKNGPGSAKDTALLASQATVDLHARWLRAAGVTVADGLPVEIHPSYALSAAQVAQKVRPGLHLSEPTYFFGDGEA